MYKYWPLEAYGARSFNYLLCRHQKTLQCAPPSGTLLAVRHNLDDFHRHLRGGQDGVLFSGLWTTPCSHRRHTSTRPCTTQTFSPPALCPILPGLLASILDMPTWSTTTLAPATTTSPPPSTTTPAPTTTTCSRPPTSPPHHPPPPPANPPPSSPVQMRLPHRRLPLLLPPKERLDPPRPRKTPKPVPLLDLHRGRLPPQQGQGHRKHLHAQGHLHPAPPPRARPPPVARPRGTPPASSPPRRPPSAGDTRSPRPGDVQRPGAGRSFMARGGGASG